MDAKKKKRLEEKGWKVGTVQEAFGLADEDMAYIEMKSAFVSAVRELRAEKKLTQTQLAAKLETSQSRVAALESGAASMDALVRALFALGASPKTLGLRLVRNPDASTGTRKARNAATLSTSVTGLAASARKMIGAQPARRRGRSKKAC